MDVAKRLKEWRLANNLTQAQAAAKVGSAHPSWSEWEYGKKRPSPAKAFALEEVTGIPAREWFMDPPHAHAEPAAASEQEAPAPHEPATEAP